MRKLALLLALWLCISAGSAIAPLISESAFSAEADDAPVFILPAALKEIGEGAFENTAAESVIIPEGTESIGDRAFADNEALRTVLIPESVAFIGEHSFDGSMSVTIQAEEGSYAVAWAQEHQVACIQAESAASGLSRLRKLLGEGFFLSFSLCGVCPALPDWQRGKSKRRDKSMRPQDRPELYPIQYRFP